MAFVSTEIQSAKAPSALAAVGKKISAFWGSIIDANSRANEIQRLQAMSDRQLADMGLKREDIARRVFGDMMHI
ncbi:DUF1127 domain-containing protein [Falsihalocynthiibacter sp. SS001]|uniref:DUF1127 domain-containing protein n=1 Tax=Falsihalocynthiibacter sp. SS001 TaxID=3349698 RepID=UPI0036D2361F